LHFELKKILPLYFVLIAGNCCCQAIFQKTYGGGGSDWANSVCKTADGGLIMVGSTANFGAVAFDVYAIKTNGEGTIQWTRTFGGSGDDRGLDVKQTFDGGFIISGYTYSFGSGMSDFYLIRLDSIGDSLWTKTYGDSSYDNGVHAIQTSDSGFLITGEHLNPTDSIFKCCIIKTDSTGNYEWSKIFGDQVYYSSAVDVIQTSDGDYVVCGIAPGANVLLIKFDSSGDTVWTKMYGPTFNPHIKSMIQTHDGGFLLSGSILATPTDRHVFLFKADANGDLMWARTYDGSGAEGESVKQTNDAGYIVTGSTQSFGPGAKSAYLIKTDSSGYVQWSKTFGEAGFFQSSHSVEIAVDGGYVLGGISSNSNVYLIKTDSSGTSGCDEMSPQTVSSTLALGLYYSPLNFTSGLTVNNTLTQVGSGGTETIRCMDGIETQKIHGSISVFPNPSDHDLTIRSDYKGEVIVSDIHGKEMYRKQIQHGEVNLETKSFPSGFYIIRTELSTGIFYNKVLIAHQ